MTAREAGHSTQIHALISAPGSPAPCKIFEITQIFFRSRTIDWTFRTRRGFGNRLFSTCPVSSDRRPVMENCNFLNSRMLVSHFALVAALLMISGCHDGPLYGLKVANPYYSRYQWKEDEKYGITDHKRRKELSKLVNSMPRLPKARQEYWLKNLELIMAKDPSPEMRRIAVMAAGQLNDPAADQIVQTGLKDESIKVRMACCDTLGNRRDAEATRMLAETAGSTTDQDVRKSALAALGKHKGPVAVDALKIALEDRDPSTRSLVMSSLRTSTGKNYGNDPQVWIAALEGKPAKEQPVRFAERLENLIR